MKVDQKGRMTIKHLAKKQVSNREIARLLGITESTVRYHRKRQLAEAVGCPLPSSPAARLLRRNTRDGLQEYQNSCNLYFTDVYLTGELTYPALEIGNPALTSDPTLTKP